MDPIALLKRMLETAELIQACDHPSAGCPCVENAMLADSLAEDVEELDQWMRKGGFSPWPVPAPAAIPELTMARATGRRVFLDTLKVRVRQQPLTAAELDALIDVAGECVETIAADRLRIGELAKLVGHVERSAGGLVRQAGEALEQIARIERGLPDDPPEPAEG